MEINQQAQQIEEAVFEISTHAPVIGGVLRVYYYGEGRRKIERSHTANSLLQMLGLPTFSKANYVDMARRGAERVHGVLLAVATAG